MNSLTNNILMIRPAHFGYNAETAVNNAFQAKADENQASGIQQSALSEFDEMVNILREEGVRVIVVEDTCDPVKPDAIFPNNWVSFHQNGTVVTYPMFAKIRRIERRKDIIDQLSSQFAINSRYSFEFYEEDDEFLEGTGSMIFDRKYNLVYACLSPRTHATLLDKFNLLMHTKSIH